MPRQLKKIKDDYEYHFAKASKGKDTNGEMKMEELRKK
jgi:hypothetical protein